MTSFLRDLLRSTALYELVTFGGLTLFLIFAPVFGYLPYSDRPGPGWFGQFPALTWSQFWSNAWHMLSFGSFFALLGLQVAIPAAVLVLLAHRLFKTRVLVRALAVLLCAAATYYIVPSIGWYVALGAPAAWVGIGFGASAGLLLVPRRRPVTPAGA